MNSELRTVQFGLLNQLSNERYTNTVIAQSTIHLILKAS